MAQTILTMKSDGWVLSSRDAERSIVLHGKSSELEIEFFVCGCWHKARGHSALILLELGWMTSESMRLCTKEASEASSPE